LRVVVAEQVRIRIIADLSCLVRDGCLPAEAREATLTLIGWLARQMPGEPSSRDGVDRFPPCSPCAAATVAASVSAAESTRRRGATPRAKANG
jgi:hypothetical protein